MNINDIAKPVTAATLNENLEKRFGQRIKLEDFSLEQLQNSRNKVRTTLSQVETNESYDKVHTSETYQKNKLFLDILNAEIAERASIQEGKYKSDAQRKAVHANKKKKESIEEKAESQAQQKAAGAALAAKRGETPVSELQGASKEMYDSMTEKELEDFAGTKHKNLPAKKEENIEEDFDDMRPDSVPDYDENDLDYEGGMAHKQLSTIEDAADELTDIISANENLPEWVQKKIILSMSYIDTARDYMKSARKVDDRERGISTESIVREGVEDQAEIVMATKNMVDKITSWMEDTGEMQTESALEIGDSIRAELGEELSQQFTSMIRPALESLYTSLEQTRSTLVDGVRLVAGEEVEDMPGSDLDTDDLEPTVDQEDEIDLEEPADLDDEFGAADAAAGADEEAGRERRESIERPVRLARMLSSKKKVTESPLNNQRLIMALHTMQNSAEGKDKPVFAHFEAPSKGDLKPGHINVDLNAVAQNLGIPQFDYDVFKNAYDTDPQIAELVDDFNSQGLTINKSSDETDLEPQQDRDDDNSVSQMAKQATDLSDSPLG